MTVPFTFTFEASLRGLGLLIALGKQVGLQTMFEVAYD